MKLQLSKFKPWLAVLGAAFILATASTAGKADLQLKAGDRVVFYGDSITEQNCYTQYVEQFVECRYPELKIHFFNAGWGGDSAGGGLGRLNRDVLPLKPTVVTLFFGMNDGRYSPLSDDILNNYRNTMESLIKALLAKGIRVIVFTPPCIDTDKRPLPYYNATLEGLGKAAIELAVKYHLSYADVYHPMLAYQTAQKAKTAGYSFSLDGVHPNPAGHRVISYEMLAAFGVTAMPALGSIDLKTSQTTGGVSLASNVNHVVTLTASPANVPYWVDPADSESIDDVYGCGLADLAGQKLTVSGLDPGNYVITVGGATFPTTADALAKGFPILGTYSDVGQNMHELINQKDGLYFTAWRRVLIPYPAMPGIAKAYSELLRADDALETAIHSLKPPASVTITITPKSA